MQKSNTCFENWCMNNGFEKSNGAYYKNGMIWAMVSLKIKHRIDTSQIE